MKKIEAQPATTAQLLTLAQVAERLSVSKRSVVSIVSAGKLATVRVGPRMVRVSEDALESFVAGRTRGGAR